MDPTTSMYFAEIAMRMAKANMVETTTKGDCSHCRKPVLGLGKEYVTQEGKVWHRECFTTTTGGKGCHVCSEVILGDACEALGHYYHPLCFACVNCAQPVSGPFVDHNGEVCCKPCYERIKQARPNYIASAQPLVANQPSLINHQQQQKHLQQNLPQSSNDCYKCGTAIINISGSPDNGMVLSTGKHLHVRCFNCADCGNPITDGKFMAVGDNNYHPTCRASVTVTKFGGKQLLCNGCQNPITSSYMKHEDSFYHSECFRCTLCKKSIGSEGYLEAKNGRAICEACYSNGQTNKPTSIPGIGKPIYKAGLKQSGAGADTKLGMAPLGGTLSSGVATVGGKNVCPLCKKQAYPQEQVPGPQATVWHRACLRCTGCKKQLDSNGHVKNGRPYCIACEKNA